MMKKYALIVAGGSGTRMKSALPKQFMELCGKPILMHTLENFRRFDADMTLILVLPADQQTFWKELCLKHHFGIAHQIVTGGETRFHSVKNGLAVITDEGIVGIHDGVRPLVSHDTIARCYAKATETGNATPCISVHETVRQLTAEGSQIIDRSQLRLIQTPQVFVVSIIKKAFEQEYDPTFTDDASVLERTGATIYLVEGNRENIKVTEPFDLVVAEGVVGKARL